MLNVFKTTFYNNSNLGLYGFATDSYCILAENLKHEIVEKIKLTLDVPVFQLTIFNSSLIGVFCNGNENILLVPNLIKTHETKILEKLNINYEIIDTKFTALGNNLLIKEDVCLANPNLEKEAIQQLEKLNFKVHLGKIADMPTPGSCAILTKKGCLLHPDSTPDDIKQIEKLFKVQADIGTVNTGSPYVKSGIIINSRGYVLGEQTSGPETMRLDFALKTLEK